jgi:2'-hydroxyisoflavone reductase
MSTTRREFLSHAAGAAAVLAAGPALAGLADGHKKMKILFLGGTGFLGPHTVEILKEHGHEVTLFNRGNREEMFPGLELIKGNRIPGEEPGPGLEPLKAEVDKGRRWDAVIDTASVHTWTHDAAQVLKGSADHYVYISSLSAYAGMGGDGRREGDPLAEMPDDIADGITGLPYDMQYYGAVKARSEAAAEEAFPGRTTVLRPGLIVGPRDFTHRFTYWPWRVRQGGEVLAPGNPDDPVMFIDVRDLAEFLVRTIEQRTYGIFNVNGPTTNDMTIGRLLDACKAATGSDASFTFVDGEFLAERGINAWAQMPVWIPGEGETAGFHRTHVSRAAAAGLTTRPVGETIRDTLEWFDGWLPTAERRGQKFEYKPGENAPGISLAQETEVLAEWKARDE